MTPEQAARAVLDYDAEFTDALLFGMKECSHCRRERPACTTYFTRQPGGALKSKCKSCVAESCRERQRSRYANDPEYRDRVLAQRREYKARKRAEGVTW